MRIVCKLGKWLLGLTLKAILSESNTRGQTATYLRLYCIPLLSVSSLCNTI